MATAAQKTTTATPAAPAPLYELPPNNLRLKESVVREWHAIIPRGHTKEDVLRKSYWVHRARDLTRHAVVEAVAEDFSFYAKLVVMDCEKTWAHMWPVMWSERPPENVEPPKNWADYYDIDNSASGFRVINKANGDVMKDKLATRDAAMGAIVELMKKLA